MSTILIIDDNKKNLQVLGNILNEEKYRVAMAINGETAIKLAEKLCPDLIILDIMMPGMDGFEVCRLLKSKPSTKRIPIIFLTAKIDLDDIILGFEVGGSDYLTKPFKKEELIARIKTQLEISESRIKIEKQAKELENLVIQKDRLCSIVTSQIEKTLGQLIQIQNIVTNSHNSNKPDFNTSDAIHSLTESTYQMLENILWCAKVQNNLAKPIFSMLSVFDVVNSSLKKLKQIADAKNIIINNQANAMVLADERLLQIIIKNIMHNAIIYSNGNTKIDCKCINDDTSTTLQISDEGFGIKNETIEEIYDNTKFQITNNCNSKIVLGGGIGLKLSIQLAETINATLKIETQINNGTIISLIFKNTGI